MSTNDDLRELSNIVGNPVLANLMRRAADEIERLQAKLDRVQAKLDRVRELCKRRMNPSVTTGVQLFAGELLSALGKDQDNE